MDQTKTMINYVRCDYKFITERERQRVTNLELGFGREIWKTEKSEGTARMGSFLGSLDDKYSTLRVKVKRQREREREIREWGELATERAPRVGKWRAIGQRIGRILITYWNLSLFIFFTFFPKHFFTFYTSSVYLSLYFSFLFLFTFYPVSVFIYIYILGILHAFGNV